MATVEPSVMFGSVAAHQLPVIGLCKQTRDQGQQQQGGKPGRDIKRHMSPGHPLGIGGGPQGRQQRSGGGAHVRADHGGSPQGKRNEAAVNQGQYHRHGGAGGLHDHRQQEAQRQQQ